MTELVANLAFSLTVRVGDNPERFDIIEISIIDQEKRKVFTTSVETDTGAWPEHLLVADGGEAFIMLAHGCYDSWFEWWCLAYTVAADGTLNVIHREARYSPGNHRRCSAVWTSKTTAVVKWDTIDSNERVESTELTLSTKSGPAPAY